MGKKKVTDLPDLPQTKHPVTSAPKRSRSWRRLMRVASSLTISSMRPTPPDTNISQTVVLHEARGSRGLLAWAGMKASTFGADDQ